MYYLAAVIIILFIGIAFAVFAQESIDEKNAAFLDSYGWQVGEKAVEKVEIIIPNPFDAVYESYNKMQLEAGLDLRDYMGMNAQRYTYIVNNYPNDTDDEVRANVICVDNTPVGGDICTVGLSGFMHSLKYPKSD